MRLDTLGPIERLASQEESRYAINNVHFDAEHGRLVATNGHALIVLACEPEEGDVTGAITQEALEEWRKFRKNNKIATLVKFHAYEKELVIEDISEGRKSIFRRPTHQFPQYEMLMPDLEGRQPDLTFDPSLLQQVVSSFPLDEIGGGGVKSISVWICGPDKAMVIKAAHHGALCLMMPVRGMDSSYWNTKLPAGIKKPALKAAPEPATVEAPPPTPTPAEQPASPASASNAEPAPTPEATAPPKPAPKAKPPRSVKEVKPRKKKASAPIPPNGHDRSETHVA